MYTNETLYVLGWGFVVPSLIRPLMHLQLHVGVIVQHLQHLQHVWDY